MKAKRNDGLFALWLVTMTLLLAYGAALHVSKCLRARAESSIFTPAAANGESQPGPADAAVVPARRDPLPAAAMPAGFQQSAGQAGVARVSGIPPRAEHASNTGVTTPPHAAGRLQPLPFSAL